MSKCIVVLSFLCLFFSLGAVSAQLDNGVDINGIKTEYQQPNGVKLKLLVIGDSNYARTETSDGYTVVFDAQDQTYYYAKLNANKNGLVATDQVVGGKGPFGLKQHIQLSEKVRTLIAKKNAKRLNPERTARWQERIRVAKDVRLNKLAKKTLKIDDALERNVAPLYKQDNIEYEARASGFNAAPVLGNKVGLTILIQFPDDPNTPATDSVDFPVTQAKIDRYCNEDGYSDDANTGSVKDYFFDQSNGQMIYTMSVTQVVTMPLARDHYNYSDYPTNTIIRDGGESGNLLITDAIQVLKDQNFDFDGLTLQGNNVRSTNILFAGPTSGVWSKGLWPHSWGMNKLPKPEVMMGGNTRYIHEYQITNLNSTSPTIGTFIHESGHLILDFPDLYDYDYSSSGLDQHCLMSSGNHSNGGRSPSPINLYLKSVVGWTTITDLLPLEYEDGNLPATGNVGYRIVNPNNVNEFFVFENRGYAGGAPGGDKWAQHVPDEGIMIWHIDESKRGNNDEQMTLAQHYMVALVQQDGDFDLENNSSGDSQDLYDNLSLEFNDANTPNSNWWGGTASGIKMKVNSSPGVSMNVVFGTSNTIIVTSPNGGEVVNVSGSYNITWYGSIAGNVKIDLYKGGAFHETLSVNEANDGTYTWTLNGVYAIGDDYSIKVTSVDDSLLTDTSDAYFSIDVEQFVGNAIFPAGWIQSTGSDANWIVASDQASEGEYSLKNADIGDGEFAETETTVFTDVGMISFDGKVSSESGYDYLRFYIDGVEQVLDANSTELGLSGDVDWMALSFPITAGIHTFKWRYEKDGSGDDGLDTAWIDNVRYPETSDQLIVVRSPNGGEQISEDDVYTIRWDTNIGGSVKIDLHKGGSFLETLSANEANDGEYVWDLNSQFALGEDYTIKISSIDEVSVLDTSDAEFFIIKEQFVAKGVMPVNWVQTSGSDAGWIAASDEASEGQYSLKNADISDSEKAEIEYTVFTDAGVVTFDAKVSSESGYDYLRFYIDGVQQDIDTNSGNLGLSGDVDWVAQSFSVTAGVHTFMWRYEKDSSSDNGDDSAWIDNVVIPETTTEFVVVKSPNGGELIVLDQVYEMKWLSNIAGNVKIELLKGGVLSDTLSFNEVNDGSYLWDLDNQHVVGSDYSIKITSLSDGAVLDSSDGEFTINVEQFVADGVMPMGWIKSNGSDAGWKVAGDDASEGVYSLKNEVVDDAQNAEVEYRTNTDVGEISFDVKVSSESSYDYLRFYVDGVEQDLNSELTGENGLSGEVSWVKKAFPISAGIHTFKWRYEKDGSSIGGADSSWIDNVKIPEIPLVGIALWKYEYFTGDDSVTIDDGADPDGDGVTNLMEYALGLDPNDPDAGNGITVEKVGNVLSLTYTKNKEATDVHFECQHLGSLQGASWLSTNITEQVMSTNGDIDNMKASMTVPANDRHHFMRLKVELIE